MSSIPDSKGRTPLHEASQAGKLDIVAFLLKTCRLDATAKDNDGCTALHLASQSGHLDTVKYLVQEHLTITTNEGQTPWDLASDNERVNVQDYFFGGCGINVDKAPRAQKNVQLFSNPQSPSNDDPDPGKKMDERFNELDEKLNMIARELHEEQRAMHEQTQRTNANLDRVIGGLTYLATHKAQPCPPIVWLVPVGVKEHSKKNSNCLETWKNWMRNTTHKSYHLYFVCQETLEIVNDKVEIKVDREWVKRVAPLLAVGVFAIQMGLAMRDLPDFPFPALGLSCKQRIELIDDFVNAFLDDETSERVSKFRDSCERYAIAPTEGVKNLEFFGPSYESMVHQATKQGQNHWRKSIVPVLDNGRLIWVKTELGRNYHRPNLEA